eukprot:763930-Hanusia_phi.AAC.16
MIALVPSAPPSNFPSPCSHPSPLALLPSLLPPLLQVFTAQLAACIAAVTRRPSSLLHLEFALRLVPLARRDDGRQQAFNVCASCQLAALSRSTHSDLERLARDSPASAAVCRTLPTLPTLRVLPAARGRAG